MIIDLGVVLLVAAFSAKETHIHDGTPAGFMLLWSLFPVALFGSRIFKGNWSP